MPAVRLSVAMATYNGASYLDATLDGIAGQTCLPDQVVIVDDSSTDSTTQFLQEFSQAAPMPVRVLSTEKNVGSIAAFEQAISACDGNYIVLADQDDVWYPNKLSRLAAAFNSPGEPPMLAFSDADLIDEHGTLLGRRLWEEGGLTESVASTIAGASPLVTLLRASYVTGSTLAFSASLRPLLLPFPRDVPNLLHDRWIALMSAVTGRIVPIPEPLLAYRLHPDQQVGIPSHRPAGHPAPGHLTTLHQAGTPPIYTEHILVNRTLLCRISATSSSSLENSVSPSARAILADHLRHLTARAQLPTHLPTRTHHVTKEVVAGGYQRYSSGVLSATKDLLYLHRPKSPMATPQNHLATPTRASYSNEAPKSLRSLAFYLPQFHPTPENDLWWGPGFTEWRNVVAARPQFRGHLQPHLPADLGFYDLRLAETRAAQAELATRHGIDGFCYYHYWFAGRRVLFEPLDRILSSGEPHFPFCLCWANENWTRVWDGGSDEVLLEQHYSREDDLGHLRFLAPIFSDPRYLRVNGRPLFLVFRASQLPDPRRTTDLWREESSRLGLGELYLCRVESFPDEVSDPRTLGFDAAVEFQPSYPTVGQARRPRVLHRALRRLAPIDHPYLKNSVYDYRTLVDNALRTPSPPYPRHPCITPGWDNTPRRDRGATIIINSSPEDYERWATGTIHRLAIDPGNEGLLFINAWNEWGEGCHLEPCKRWASAYLEANRRALAGVPA